MAQFLHLSNSTLEKFLRLAGALSPLRFLSRRETDMLLSILAHSENSLSPKLKLSVYELLKSLLGKNRRPFGMIVVLGWKKEWEKNYASLPDATQNISREKGLNFRESPREKLIDEFLEITDFDGAILVNSRGEVVASGIYLESMQPKYVAELLYGKGGGDLSSQFGFLRKVHARHLASISASYWLPDTTVFTISEEDRSLRIFENGRIIWSSIQKEFSHD